MVNENSSSFSDSNTFYKPTIRTDSNIQAKNKSSRKVFDLVAFVRQAPVNKEKAPTIGVPSYACFDKYGVAYVPWGPLYWRKWRDTRGIPTLFTRGAQQKVKIGEGRPIFEITLSFIHERLVWDWDEWIYGYKDRSLDHPDSYYRFVSATTLTRLTVETKGLTPHQQRFIQKSRKKLLTHPPLYRSFNKYSFTQILPPLKNHRSVTPLSSSTFLKLLSNSDYHSNQTAAIKQGLITLILAEAKFLMQTDYYFATNHHLALHDQLLFSSHGIALTDLLRLLSFVFGENFSSQEELHHFQDICRTILSSSNDFIIETESFTLTMGDITFADQCHVQILFPYARNFTLFMHDRFIVPFEVIDSQTGTFLPDYAIMLDAPSNCPILESFIQDLIEEIVLDDLAECTILIFLDGFPSAVPFNSFDYILPVFDETTFSPQRTFGPDRVTNDSYEGIREDGIDFVSQKVSFFENIVPPSFSEYNQTDSERFYVITIPFIRLNDS